jgi:2,4-dienoyl-CoA reductase-like NADH-dependent reductase (Old Yellow Enzyme family)
MLLERVEAYLRATRMPPTRFGREALRDPNFVFNLREGRKLRPSTSRRLEAFLSARESAAVPPQPHR